MIEFVVVSSDRYLVVSWIRGQERKPDRPGRPKQIVRVCSEDLAKYPVKTVFKSHL